MAQARDSRAFQRDGVKLCPFLVRPHRRLDHLDLDLVVGLVVGIENAGAPEFAVAVIASINIAQKVGNRDWCFVGIEFGVDVAKLGGNADLNGHIMVVQSRVQVLHLLL